MANYSIKDLEKLSGIKAHTIRIWEKRYNLIKPGRTETNIRLYNDKDLRKILNISILNRKGLKISHIARLNDKGICDKVNELAKSQIDTSTKIDQLVIALMELDKRKLEQILNASIIHSGFEETVIQTIFPLLRKVGILWQTGIITPAQEHFITNIIRQKLLLAIDGIIETDYPDTLCFLLFLPEGEFHEIGLLFYYYLLLKRGNKVIYLGQSVPEADLEFIVKLKNCNYLITSFSSNFTGLNVIDYLKDLSSTFKDQKILVSLYEGATGNKKLPSNVIKIRNPKHFIEMLPAFTG